MEMFVRCSHGRFFKNIGNSEKLTKTSSVIPGTFTT